MVEYDFSPGGKADGTQMEKDFRMGNMRSLTKTLGKESSPGSVYLGLLWSWLYLWHLVGGGEVQ